MASHVRAKQNLKKPVQKLDRDRIVSAALDLLDETGVGDLTTRRLAEALNIKSASLYWHFRSKDELLDHMCGAMFAACIPKTRPCRTPSDILAWLGEGARRIRKMALSRRDGATIMARAIPASEEAEVGFGENIQVLVRSGCSEFDAVSILQTMRCFAIGHAIQQQTQAEGNQLSKSQQDKMFETGLRIILDGVGSNLDSLS